MLQEQNRSCVSALRPSKQMKEIDQLDHFCARKTLTLKKKQGRVHDPTCESEFH